MEVLDRSEVKLRNHHTVVEAAVDTDNCIADLNRESRIS